jgi:hypothetical protein
VETIPGLISLFGEAAFPIAVAAFLLISQAKQLNQIRMNQLKQMVMLAMLLKKQDVAVPDTKLEDLIKVLMEE